LISASGTSLSTGGLGASSARAPAGSPTDLFSRRTLKNHPRKSIAGENAFFAFSNESSCLPLQSILFKKQQHPITLPFKKKEEFDEKII
jgi:hypothetical protein